MGKTNLLFLLLLGAVTTLNAAQAEERAGWPILGSCATHLADHPERTRNIQIVLTRLEGHTVEPGAVFSFNGATGSRSARGGYLPAPVLFQDKTSVQIGGGVCQVSSALYNAALLADLVIVERHRHSSPITYLPLGLDATVSYGYKDLKFKNPHPFPIGIAGAVVQDTLTLSIIGKETLSYDVDLVTQVNEIDAPFRDGASESGKEVFVYRVRSKDGRVMEKEYVGRDYYHPVGAGPRQSKGHEAHADTQ